MEENETSFLDLFDLKDIPVFDLDPNSLDSIFEVPEYTNNKNDILLQITNQFYKIFSLILSLILKLQ